MKSCLKKEVRYFSGRERGERETEKKRQVSGTKCLGVCFAKFGKALFSLRIIFAQHKYKFIVVK